jgi:tripartite-type tricarboxylate transporter receptor subunit TctC
MNKRKLMAVAAVLACTGVCALAQTAKPAAWPTRTVRILVGFPGGSSPDLVARALAEPLGRALGQSVIVENKVGAAGNIAADQIAKATDDHTIGVLINGNMTIARMLSPATPYDPLKDLTPISLVGTAPLVLASSAAIPAGTGAAFFEAARAAGSKWSYGSPGVGTVGHIGMELLKSKSGIDPVHIPYPGNPQVINGLIAGQLQLALLPPALAMAQVRAGKLHAIGVTSSGRSTLVPELPSLADAGVPGFNLEIWTAVAAPASFPKPLAARLSALISEIVRSPDMRQRLFQQGWQAVGSSQEGLANRIKADTGLLGDVIRTRAIRAE